MLYPQKTSNSSSPTMTPAPSLPGQSTVIFCALRAVKESALSIRHDTKLAGPNSATAHSNEIRGSISRRARRYNGWRVRSVISWCVDAE